MQTIWRWSHLQQVVGLWILLGHSSASYFEAKVSCGEQRPWMQYHVCPPPVCGTQVNLESTVNSIFIPEDPTLKLWSSGRLTVASVAPLMGLS